MSKAYGMAGWRIGRSCCSEILLSCSVRLSGVSPSSQRCHAQGARYSPHHGNRPGAGDVNEEKWKERSQRRRTYLCSYCAMWLFRECLLLTDSLTGGRQKVAIKAVEYGADWVRDKVEDDDSRWRKSYNPAHRSSHSFPSDRRSSYAL
eukprot:763575-Hanusia_phi.AAC.3